MPHAERLDPLGDVGGGAGGEVVGAGGVVGPHRGAQGGRVGVDPHAAEVFDCEGLFGGNFDDATPVGDGDHIECGDERFEAP